MPRHKPAPTVGQVVCIFKVAKFACFFLISMTYAYIEGNRLTEIMFIRHLISVTKVVPVYIK